MIKNAAAVLLGVAMLLFAGTAQADWYENFSGGTVHEAWAFVGDKVSFGTDTSQGYLLISNQRQAFPPYNPILPPTGASLVVGEVQGSANLFADGTVRALLNPGGVADPTYQYTDDWLGLVIRSHAGSGTGYAAVLDLDDGAGNSNLYLFRSDGNPTNPVPLGADMGLTLSTTTAYNLSLRAWGDGLLAELYDTGGTLLASVSATDSTYSDPGFGGVISAFDSTFMLTTFDNVGAAFGVPEPASVVLMGLGGLGLMGFARRRRRNRK